MIYQYLSHAGFGLLPDCRLPSNFANSRFAFSPPTMHPEKYASLYYHEPDCDNPLGRPPGPTPTASMLLMLRGLTFCTGGRPCPLAVETVNFLPRLPPFLTIRKRRLRDVFACRGFLITQGLGRVCLCFLSSAS